MNTKTNTNPKDLEAALKSADIQKFIEGLTDDLNQLIAKGTRNRLNTTLKVGARPLAIQEGDFSALSQRLEKLNELQASIETTEKTGNELRLLKNHRDEEINRLDGVRKQLNKLLPAFEEIQLSPEEEEELFTTPSQEEIELRTFHKALKPQVTRVITAIAELHPEILNYPLAQMHLTDEEMRQVNKVRLTDQMSVKDAIQRIFDGEGVFAFVKKLPNEKTARESLDRLTELKKNTDLLLSIIRNATQRSKALSDTQRIQTLETFAPLRGFNLPAQDVVIGTVRGSGSLSN